MEFVFILTLLVCSAVFYFICARSFLNAPGVYILHVLALMVPPALLHVSGFSFENFYLDAVVADRALLKLSVLAALSFTGVVAGYILFRRFPAGRFLFPDYRYERSDIITAVGITVLTALSVLIVYKPLSMAGFDVAQAADIIRHDFFFAGAAYLKQFQYFANFLSGAFLVYLMQARVARWALFCVLGLFVLNLGLSVVLGGKTAIIFPLAFTALAYEICVVRRGVLRIILTSGLLFALVIGLQFTRSEVVQGVEKPVSEHAYVGLYYILYDSTLLYLDTNDELHETETGEDFVRGIAAVVPRALWPGKPEQNITLGSRFKSQITQGEGQGGWPVYGFAQWYVNFGWAGVFIGGVLTGWILALLQARYGDYRENVFSFMILWNVIFLVLGPWPGGVHSFFPSHYVLFVLPLFVFKVLSAKSLWRMK